MANFPYQMPNAQANPNPNSVTTDHPAHPSNQPTEADRTALAKQLWQQHVNSFAWMPPTHSIIDLRTGNS